MNAADRQLSSNCLFEMVCAAFDVGRSSYYDLPQNAGSRIDVERTCLESKNKPAVSPKSQEALQVSPDH